MCPETHLVPIGETTAFSPEPEQERRPQNAPHAGGPTGCLCGPHGPPALQVATCSRRPRRRCAQAPPRRGPCEGPQPDGCLMAGECADRQGPGVPALPLRHTGSKPGTSAGSQEAQGAQPWAGAGPPPQAAGPPGSPPRGLASRRGPRGPRETSARGRHSPSGPARAGVHSHSDPGHRAVMAPGVRTPETGLPVRFQHLGSGRPPDLLGGPAHPP